MIVAYLVMIILIVLSLFYLFSSIAHGLAKYSAEEDKSRLSFFEVRRKEIAEEEEAGRLTPDESAQLLVDVDSESNSIDSRKKPLFQANVTFARWVMLGATAMTVLGSVSLYQWIGYAKEVSFTQDLHMQRLSPQKITDFLQYRTERYDRAEDWYYLATEYMRAEQYAVAVEAFETALEKLPKNAEGRVALLVEYAQAIFYANGNQSSPKMQTVVSAILQQDPTQAIALDLKGVADFAQQNYLGAVLSWQEAIRYSAHSRERLALLSAINKARELGRIDYQQVAPIITDQLAVKVEWDTAQYEWHQDDVLLVYAVLNGQKMPLAIQRVFPEDLEQPILLTNLDSMTPTATLAQVQTVDLVVKLSNINDNDLTKGRIIGIKHNLLVNSREIFVIKVAL